MLRITGALFSHCSKHNPQPFTEPLHMTWRFFWMLIGCLSHRWMDWKCQPCLLSITLKWFLNQEWHRKFSVTSGSNFLFADLWHVNVSSSSRLLTFHLPLHVSAWTEGFFLFVYKACQFLFCYTLVTDFTLFLLRLLVGFSIQTWLLDRQITTRTGLRLVDSLETNEESCFGFFFSFIQVKPLN